jgi:hypothetical protein
MCVWCMYVCVCVCMVMLVGVIMSPPAVCYNICISLGVRVCVCVMHVCMNTYDSVMNYEVRPRLHAYACMYVCMRACRIS